jgi:hypothetical protein
VTLNLSDDNRSDIGKLGCDHAVPCGRCIRRKHAHQCSYDPVTGEPNGLQRRREPKPVRSQSKIQNHTQIAGRAIQLKGFASSPSVGVAADSNQVDFLGSSSYSALFDQINGSLDMPVTVNLLDPAVNASPVPEDLILKGADVLFQLRDHETLDRLLQRWLVIGDGYLIFEPIYRVLMRELTE